MLNIEIGAKEDLIKIQKEAKKNFNEAQESKIKLEDKIEKLQDVVNKIESFPMDYQNEKQKELKTVKDKIIDLSKKLALIKEVIEVYSFEFNLS